MLVTLEHAYLLTDGRYFIAASRQLENTAIQLMKMGEKGVETFEEIDMLNRYHELVLNTLTPYLDEKMTSWLKEVTRKVEKIRG